MKERSYKTAFAIAKIGEILSWIIIILGVLVGLSLMKDYGVAVGVGIAVLIAIPGFYLVYLSQLTLVFIDTENNTRQSMAEIRKTNAMLAETLGTMVNHLKALVDKGGSVK